MNEVHYKIEPFNEFAIGSCFEDAYLPAISALGGDKISFILNVNYYFRYVNNGFCVSSYGIKTRNEMEEQFGIESYTIEDFVENVVEFIISCLEENKLVICKTVNAVSYDPVTRRKNQRSFSPHWILVYGFSRDKKEFDVLEHQTIVSAQYKPYKMLFDDLEQAYLEGYEYEQDKMNMYILKSKAIARKEINHYEAYCNKYTLVEEKFISSRKSLIRHMQELQRLKTGEALDSQEIVLISEVIKYFQRENWLQKQIGISIEITGELLKALNLLRTYCIKYNMVPTDKICEGIFKYSSAVEKLSDQWFEQLALQIKGEKL